MQYTPTHKPKVKNVDGLVILIYPWKILNSRDTAMRIYMKHFPRECFYTIISSALEYYKAILFSFFITVSRIFKVSILENYLQVIWY